MGRLPDDGRGFDYRAARIGAAGALLATIVALAIIDAMSVQYVVDTTTFATLVAALLILLGVEATALLRK